MNLRMGKRNKNQTRNCFSSNEQEQGDKLVQFNFPIRLAVVDRWATVFTVSGSGEVCPSVSPVDLVEAAFFLCSYELSIKTLHSPWCFLFQEDDAKVGDIIGWMAAHSDLWPVIAVCWQVLEFKSDLKQFWKRFHGHVINGLSSCSLFHHVFRTLDKAGRPRRSGHVKRSLIVFFPT